MNVPRQKSRDFRYEDLFSSHDFLDDPTVDVGEAEVAAGVAVG